MQQLVNGLSLGALYALIAVGYTVVYGIIQLINFAHGEIFMIGAFRPLTVWLVVPGKTVAIWMLPLMLVGGVVASVGTALLMERFAYRPLRNAPRLAPLITAIGVSIFLQEFIRLFYEDIPGFPDSKRAIPFPQIDYVTGPAFTLGGVTSSELLSSRWPRWWCARSSCTSSSTGPVSARAMLATSQDPDTAPADGDQRGSDHHGHLRARRDLGNRRGLELRPSLHTNVDFKIGFLAGLKAFTTAVLGGIGNVAGAVVGGLVLGVVEAMATFIPGQFGGSAWKDVWAFVLLILVLVFRPQGLLGARVDRA